MELPTPAADSAVVPQAMETTPTVLADNKKESPSSGPSPLSVLPVPKDKQQEVSGASSTSVTGR